MTNVLIDGKLVDLPPRWTSGQVHDDFTAEVLHLILTQRILSRVRYLVGKGELRREDVQRKVNELQAMPLAVQSAADLEDDDPIKAEALDMARELIVGRMASEGFPPPRNLDIHAKNLLEHLPQIMDRARLKLEARHRAAAAVIGDIV